MNPAHRERRFGAPAPSPARPTVSSSHRSSVHRDQVSDAHRRRRGPASVPPGSASQRVAPWEDVAMPRAPPELDRTVSFLAGKTHQTDATADFPSSGLPRRSRCPPVGHLPPVGPLSGRPAAAVAPTPPPASTPRASPAPSPPPTAAARSRSAGGRVGRGPGARRRWRRLRALGGRGRRGRSGT